MQAILGLLPGEATRPIEHIRSDLFAEMRREAVHRDCDGIGEREQAGVDAVRAERCGLWKMSPIVRPGSSRSSRRRAGSAFSSSARSSNVSSSERFQSAILVKLRPLRSFGTHGIGSSYNVQLG